MTYVRRSLLKHKKINIGYEFEQQQQLHKWELESFHKSYLGAKSAEYGIYKEENPSYKNKKKNF